MRGPSTATLLEAVGFLCLVAAASWAHVAAALVVLGVGLIAKSYEVEMRRRERRIR